MNLADVFAIVFVILGFLVVFIGYWLMAVGLFPRQTERCAERFGRTPVKAALLGAATFVPLVAIGLAISGKAPNGGLKLLGLGVALAAALVALFGSAGLALRIGQGLPSGRDESEPWRRVLRGGIVLGLTFVLPFLGTFVVMPFAFVAGFGAFLLARREPRPAPQTVAAPVPPPLAATVP